MRTTLDIDQQSYRLAKAIAAQKGVSMGKVVAEAISHYYGGESTVDKPILGRSDFGFVTMTIGRPITPEEVAEALDE